MLTGHGPPALSGQVAADLRDALARAGLTVEALETTLGIQELSATRAELAVHVRRLSGRDPFSTLVKLFVLGVAVGADEVRVALEPLGLETAAELGLVAGTASGDVRATVRLVPHGDYYVASDLPHESAGELPFDHVPGIQAPSVTLAKLAVRRPVASAFDLGTGCGIQALLAARHAERVVAGDVSTRALGFAAFNTRLNGIDNVEPRLGEGFAPVEGERFGLIVANPPYVISPDSDYAYRDSGRARDDLCRELVRRAPALLEEGGFAHLLISWVHAPNGDWTEPLRDWIGESGCDAWLLHYKSEDPLTHAASWLRPLGDTPQFEAALDRWLAYLRRQGIEAIGYGAVVLRRRAGGSNWVRADEIPLDRLEPASEHVLRVFSSQDHLAAVADDRALLAERVALVAAHRVEQTLRSEDGGFVVLHQTLALDEGLAFRAEIDRYTVSLLPRLDGVRPLGEVVEIVARELGIDEAERDEFFLGALPVVRRLLELGFADRVA